MKQAFIWETFYLSTLLTHSSRPSSKWKQQSGHTTWVQIVLCPFIIWYGSLLSWKHINRIKGFSGLLVLLQEASLDRKKSSVFLGLFVKVINCIHSWALCWTGAYPMVDLISLIGPMSVRRLSDSLWNSNWETFF